MRTAARVVLLLIFAVLTRLDARASASELHFSLPGDPKTLDPLQVSDENSETIRYLTSGVLVRVNRVTDKPEPELAESWTIGEGGRAITFHLRAGLMFSDGTTLGADDVARTLSAALDDKHPSPAGDPFRSADGNPEIKVFSVRDIRIRYARPKPDLEWLFDSLSILPARTGKLPVSAGPFVVTEYRPGDHVLLRRNARYWKRDAAGKQLPYLDSIRIDIQPSHEIEMRRFLRGELHLINKLHPEDFDAVSGNGRNIGPSLDSEFLWFNQKPSAPIPGWKTKWFSSAAFRHAVSESIHRDDLARIVFRGHAHPAAGPVSPANLFWFDQALKPLPFDPESALRRLTADGFVLRDGVLRDRGGHPVEFSVITSAGSRTREGMAAVIQDDLRRLGIRINIVTLDFSSLIERIAKTAQYEACLLGFADESLDPREQMNVWLSSGAQHAWWPSEKTPATAWEAEIDKFELLQASEPSRALRKKAYDRVQQLAVEQEPIVYLVNADRLVAISPALKGVHPTVAPPQLLWNVEWLRLN